MKKTAVNSNAVHRIDLAINMEKSGTRIKSLFREKGYTISDILTITGLATQQSVYKWYSGKSLPSLETLIILSQALHVKVTDLLVIEGEFDDTAGAHRENAHSSADREEAHSFRFKAVKKAREEKQRQQSRSREEPGLDVPAILFGLCKIVRTRAAIKAFMVFGNQGDTILSHVVHEIHEVSVLVILEKIFVCPLKGCRKIFFLDVALSEMMQFAAGVTPVFQIIHERLCIVFIIKNNVTHALTSQNILTTFSILIL